MKQLVLRYFLLILFSTFFLSVPFVFVMERVLATLTYAVFVPFATLNLEGNFLIFSSVTFAVVEACIAPSMYMLFTILFFSTPLKFKELFKLWGIAVVLFSVFNLLRIIFLISVTLVDPVYFDMFHLFFYEVLSALGFFIIGFILTKKMREEGKVPLLTDLRSLWNSRK